MIILMLASDSNRVAGQIKACSEVRSLSLQVQVRSGVGVSEGLMGAEEEVVSRGWNEHRGPPPSGLRVSALVSCVNVQGGESRGSVCLPLPPLRVISLFFALPLPDSAHSASLADR